jgi:hypothetical protein
VCSGNSWRSEKFRAVVKALLCAVTACFTLSGCHASGGASGGGGALNVAFNAITGTRRTQGARRWHKAKPLHFVDRAFSASPGIITSDTGTYTFKVKELGVLNMPTGALVAADPLTTPDRPPFDTHLEPGRYRVVVAIKQLLTDSRPRYAGDLRIAYAKLLVSEKPVVQWKLATTAHESDNLHKLDDNMFYGYPVDAGVGSFMDVNAAQVLTRSQALADKLLSELSAHQVNTWTWCDLIVDPATRLNAIVFSGYGDGVFATYYGYDRDGKIAAVVTDFEIVEETDH